MGYVFETMSDERLAEYLDEPRNAVSATTRQDGSPHVSPTWFLWEDEKLYIPLLTSSVKYKNLVRDPRISVCVEGGYPDLTSATITGTVEFITGDEERSWYLRVCERYYHDPADNEQGAETFHRWGEAVTLVVTPTKIHTQDYSGWE